MALPFVSWFLFPGAIGHMLMEDFNCIFLSFNFLKTLNVFHSVAKGKIIFLLLSLEYLNQWSPFGQENQYLSNGGFVIR